MEGEAPKNPLESIRPVVVAHAVDAAGLATLSERFTVYELDIGDTGYVLRQPSGAGSLTLAPQNTVALFVGAPAAGAAHAALKVWSTGQRLAAPIVPFSTDQVTWVDHYAQRLQRLAAGNADLLSRLAVLRELHEELQNSYDEMRCFMEDQGTAVPKLGFLNDVDADRAMAATVRVVEQSVPVEFRRLCALSLFNVCDIPSYAEGTVEVELYAPDDDAIGHRWRVPYTRFERGWITFAFEKRKGLYLRRSTALRLTFHTTAGHGPLFGLGRSLLRADKAAVFDGERQTRALAMKAWVSLAGAPITLTPQMWPTIRIDAPAVTHLELPLSPDVPLRDVRQLGESLDYQPVAWTPSGKWILVHPVDRTPTIALLPGACPPGTQRVVAEVETGNDRAGFVEYGLCVTDENDFPAGRDLGALAAGIEWHCLPAKTGGELVLDLPKPLSRRTDLLLLTRVPDGGSANFCWAYFKRLYLEGAF